MYKLKRAQITGMNQHYRRFSFESYLDSMEACGITSLEMWCGAPHFVLDSGHYMSPAPLLRMAKERGMHFSALTAPSMQWQHQFASPGPERQKRAVAYYKNGAAVAAELGAAVMSINSGWGYWDEDQAEGMKRFREAVSQVADYAQTLGVTLALESLQPVESNLVVTLKDAEQFFASFRHPAVKMMVDVDAVYASGETVEQWFQTFGKEIIHCHFIDGGPSGHRVFGDGVFPLEAIIHTLEKYQYSGALTVELGSAYTLDPFKAERQNMAALGRLISD